MGKLVVGKGAIRGQEDEKAFGSWAMEERNRGQTDKEGDLGIKQGSR